TLGRDLVSRRDAADPVHEVGDAERQDHGHHLPEAVDDDRVAGEQRALGLAFLCGREGDQVRVAEAALDRRRLDRFPANRADLRVVAHTGVSLSVAAALLSTAVASGYCSR